MPTITGTSGDDTLNGTSVDDIISGKAGADTIAGNGGNDTLYSGEVSPPFDQFTGFATTPPLLDTGTEVDTLRGGAGYDLIFAGYGDNVDGGDDVDTLFISFQGATSGISFNITQPTQVIGGGTITGIEAVGWIQGSNYNDNIVLGTGYYTSNGDNDVAFGMAGDDTIIAGYTTAVLDGGEGSDILDARNSQSLQEIDGGNGNDTIYGARVGVGVVNGDDGNDYIYVYSDGEGYGGNGDDLLALQSPSAGSGYLSGDGGNDRLIGDNRGDALLGGDGLDNLHGAAGNDLLDGGADTDVISGDSGDDTITGGGGGDTFLFGLNDGHDIITDFAAGDIVQVDGYSSAQSITQVGADVVMALSTSDLITFQNTTVTTVQAGLVFGVAVDDTLIGSTEDDFLRGFGGNDTISGNDGWDTLVGDSGADHLDGGAGNDLLFSGGTSPLLNSGNPPFLDSGVAVDTLIGGDGADTIWAGYGDNVDGGSNGPDGDGDKLYISFQGASHGISFDAHLATQLIGGGTITGIEDISWVEGSSYDDQIDVGSSFSTPYGDLGHVLGMGGNDNLIAGEFTWLLDGGEGKDLLDGRDSGYLHELDGGAGNDSLYGNRNVAGAGITINGGDGNDILVSGTADDTLTGGSGVDIFRYAMGDGSDVITDLEAGETVQITGYAAARSIVEDSGGVTVVLDESQQLRFQNTSRSTVEAALQFLSGEAIDGSKDGEVLLGSTGDDIISGLGGDDKLSGSGGNDWLYGDSGNDTLNGGPGADHMAGGLGDDTYRTDGADVLVENAGEGTDTVISAQSFTLGDNFENLTLGITVTDGGEEVLVRTGRGNELDNQIAGTHQDDILYGMAGNDTLTGINGNDYFDGGTGADTMIGGMGADTYVVDNVGDLIQGEVVSNDYPGDTVISSISYDIYDTGIENLTLTGSENLSANGNERDNVITGNSGDNLLTGYFGNDILFGGAGNDSLDGGNDTDAMHGGLGDDVYYVDTGADTVIENAGEGIDRVYSTVSYGLGANVEMLFLTGDIAIDGTGNALDNSLVGNSEANVLNGASGADMMWGGLGDDTYYVDNAGDLPIENPGEGRDRVYSSVSYTLGANMEILALLGSSAINAAGNGLANTLIGNSAANVLNGAGGADSMLGGAGDDTYYVDNIGDIVAESASAGRDRVYSSVSYALGANVEILALLGSSAINATGNGLNNTIVGNSAANIIDGGTGADSMSGGLGADTYYVDNSGDVVVEPAGTDRDRVYSSVSYALSANVEILLLTGTSAINGTGNGLANTIIGNSAANVINGGAGADYMAGGYGDDTYYVDNSGDSVVENASAGRDRVYSSISYTLADNAEILALLGTSAINGTGNALGNTLVGNSAANVLAGGGGADVVTGGLGGDTFVFRDGDFAGPTFSPDRIMDFDHAQGDRINLAGVDANTGATFTGDQAFAFIGTAAFHHTAGELRYEIVNGNTFVSGDTNGDGLADFVIRLDGSHALVSGDFVL